jgi:sugar lactone lactonase YvrE
VTTGVRAHASTLAAERVLDVHLTLGESPFWSTRERALWLVDLRAPAVLRFGADTRALSRFSMDALCGAVLPSVHGGLLVALATGIVRFDPLGGTLAPLFAPETSDAGNRLNETKADRRGRLWTSTMRDFGAAVTGALYRATSPTTVTRMLGGICVPNGLAWSPDDRTMYFADTRDRCIRAYAFDAEHGELGPMRVLVDADALPGGPDGAAVDADGCLWSARFGGGCVARITPAGRVDFVVRVPVSNVTSCAFGDADLRTLYITTARQRMTPEQLQREPDAGALFAVRVAVPGLPEPECIV